MKHGTTIAAGLALALALASGCAKRADMAEYAGGAPEGTFAPLAESAKAASRAEPAPPPGSPAGTPAAAEGRKLAWSADMRLEVRDVGAAEREALAAVAAAGGYAQSRSSDEYSVYMVLRLPSAALEPLMDGLAGSGKLLSRSVSAEDVTDAYFDLEGRLRNKRILEERYRAYLREAVTVSDMLDVEARLSETTNEIEWLEGSFRELGKRIDLATLSLELRPVYAADLDRTSLGQALGRFFSGAGGVFRGAAVFLVGAVVYGVPAILALALLWWLALGKVGLLRRLFELVRAPRK